MKQIFSNVLFVLLIGLPLGICIFSFVFGSILGGGLADLFDAVWEYRVFIIIIGAVVFFPFVAIMIYFLNKKTNFLKLSLGPDCRVPSTRWTRAYK